MVAFLRKNFSRGVLAADLTVIASFLIMKAGHNLPVAAGTFPLVIWDFEASPDPADALDLEIVLASYSGVANKYNITRAQEGTLALVHYIDDRVALHYTAGMSEEDLDYLPNHVLTGSEHTASGLTPGHVLKALTDTTFDFAEFESGVYNLDGGSASSVFVGTGGSPIDGGGA